MANPLTDTTFPPPISGSLYAQPSYAASISDGNPQSSGSVFRPNVISMPVGMTVIWSNSRAGQYTVTTLSGNGYTPPEAINSTVIAADGGSFMYTFTKPGVYRYTDLSNPKASGIVDVGSAVQTCNSFDMYVEGMDKLSSGSHEVTLRFVPKTMSMPPTTAITYQVTVSDASGKLVTRNFDDTDGVLDLGLSHKARRLTMPPVATVRNMGSRLCRRGWPRQHSNFPHPRAVPECGPSILCHSDCAVPRQHAAQ